MTDIEIKLNEGVFLTEGWLEDLLEAIEREESKVSMNSNDPKIRAEGMRMALEEIKNHI